MVLIPIPLILAVGIMVGVTAFIPNVFFRMVTWESPSSYSMSTSLTCAPVNPSITTRFGAIV